MRDGLSTGGEDRDGAGTGGVAALERGLRLVMILGRGGPATLSALARDASLNKTTVLRLLRSLGRYGFTLRGADGRYLLGPAVLLLSANATPAEMLGRLLAPQLAALAEATGETVALFVRHRDERLCIARSMGWHPVSHNLQVGDRLSMDAGASADVLRAFEAGRPSPFDGGIRLSLGARVPELAALAAPIFDGDGRLLAALSISGTVTRLREASYADGVRAKLGAAMSEVDELLRLQR